MNEPVARHFAPASAESGMKPARINRRQLKKATSRAPGARFSSSIRPAKAARRTIVADGNDASLSG